MNLETTSFKIIKRYSLVISLIWGVFLFLGTALVAPLAQAITISPPRIELDGDPGTSVTAEFKVTNESSSNATYYTQVENFESKDESGNPQFVQTQEGLATWINVPTTVTVNAGEQKTISFTINVPRNAEPGGYFSSVFVRTTPPPSSAGEVSIGARLGTLVLFRVNGDIQEGVDILEFSTKDKKRWFNSLPVEFYYRFQNTGADRVKPEGEVIVKNLIGLKAKVLSANRTEGSVLPRSIRRFDMAWMNGGGGQENPELSVEARNSGGFFEEAKYQWNHFAVGYYTANLNVTFGTNNNTANGKFRFFVFPWQLLIILVGGLIILLIVIRFILKRYNRYIISKHAPQRPQGAIYNTQIPNAQTQKPTRTVKPRNKAP